MLPEAPRFVEFLCTPDAEEFSRGDSKIRLCVADFWLLYASSSHCGEIHPTWLEALGFKAWSAA
jgi:hypothetical protein